MHYEVLKDIEILFGLALVTVVLFRRLMFPSIIGFLVTGILAGPHALAIIKNTHEVEKMAVDLVRQRQQSLKSGRYRLIAVETSPPFQDVVVEIAPRDPEADFGTRITYRIEGELIRFESLPEAIERETKEKIQRKANAREVAVQAINGTAPDRPNIYGKYLYVPRKEGSCFVTVDEKNLELTVVGTYEFDLCAEE